MHYVALSPSHEYTSIIHRESNKTKVRTANTEMQQTQEQTETHRLKQTTSKPNLHPGRQIIGTKSQQEIKTTFVYEFCLSLNTRGDIDRNTAIFFFTGDLSTR